MYSPRKQIQKIQKNTIHNVLLTTRDINKIMRQIDKHNKHFKFIDVTPIDFDTWPRLDIKKFSIKKELNKSPSTTQFGFVFNTAPHGHSGKHWVSMFVDVGSKAPYLFYYDSTGYPIEPEIKKLRNRIMAQARRLGIPIVYKHARYLQHQKGNTECGMFAVFMLMSLATNTKPLEFFTERNPHLSNATMKLARSAVFR